MIEYYGGLYMRRSHAVGTTLYNGVEKSIGTDGKNRVTAAHEAST